MSLHPQEHYRIGVYSSASFRTVQTALALLEEAAGGRAGGWGGGARVQCCVRGWKGGSAQRAVAVPQLGCCLRCGWSACPHPQSATPPSLLCAGPEDAPLFDRKLVLHRSDTALAPLAHTEAGGKEWDTCKPLKPYFRHLHRVLLVDDDRCMLPMMCCAVLCCAVLCCAVQAVL